MSLMSPTILGSLFSSHLQAHSLPSPIMQITPLDQLDLSQESTGTSLSREGEIQIERETRMLWECSGGLRELEARRKTGKSQGGT